MLSAALLPPMGGGIHYMDNHIDRTLRECRMLLTMLRTPKLRRAFVRVLAAQDASDTDGAQATSGTVGTAGAVTGPLRQIGWIGEDGVLSNDGLTAAAQDIRLRLGDTAVLATSRITQMPPDGEERIALLDAVVGRVFENMGPRPQLSEPELNARLAMLVDEVAVFRRYAVDYGLLERSQDGSRYWLPGTAQTHDGQ